VCIPTVSPVPSSKRVREPPEIHNIDTPAAPQTSDHPSSSASTVASAPELDAPGAQGLFSTDTGLDTVSDFDIDAILSSINLPTFLPSLGGEDGGYTQSPPIQWDDLDLTWLQQSAGTNDLSFEGGNINGDEVVGTDEIDEATSQHL
jgi:hypothetical protein